MGPGAQILNLAADYLLPELRGRQIHHVADLVAILATVARLIRLTSSNALHAQLDEWRSQWDGVRAAFSA